MPDLTPPATLAPSNLDSVLEHALIGKPMALGRRFLGIEVERLILHTETRECAPLGFCRQLLADLAADIQGKKYFDGEVLNRVDGDGYSFTMEPGGQLELATDPRSSLAEVDPTMTAIRELVDNRLNGTGYSLCSLGHAPVSKIADLELLPRERYKIMDASMLPRGHLTRNMMRATAGFQLTYDVDDRDDAGRKLALLNRLAPLMLAMTANSRMIEGEDSGFASFRHYVWLHTDRDRVGVPPGGLHAETAIDGYKQFAKRATMMFEKRDGVLRAAPARPFEDVVADGEVTMEELELHLSGLFPFVRLRNYLEVRYLDAVEWKLARGILALLSGVIYCPTATARAEALSASLVPADDAAFLALHTDAARRALDAQDIRGTSFRELARELLRFSAATLGGGDCRWAEPGDLDVVSAHIG
jgi:glutamate--cysteine ligase